MHLQSFHVRNFRRLKDIHVEMDPKTSIFVGANNSGKTSATQVFQLFLGLSNEKFTIHDFSASCWSQFDLLGTNEFAENDDEILLPTISLDLWFEVKAGDLHRVIDLLPSLNWSSFPVGVRLEFAAKNPTELLQDFREAKNKALQVRKDKQGDADGFHPWPETLTDYLSKRLGAEYEVCHYVIDRAQFDENFSQKDSYVPLKLGDDKGRGGAKILKTLLRVDFLDAQRHLSDTKSQGRAENLSRRLNRFYERNLEKRGDDYEALRALANTETELDAHLAAVFESTLKNLNELGYPGLTNPRLTIKSALDPESIVSQNAKVHYALGKPGEASKDLPDKYSGLGFKNLIYMVVELLDFNERWKDEDENRAPLHLIIIEEPEAHLHVQLQQVFIKKVFDILQEPSPNIDHFTSQLIVTTHSPHILYESDFSPIRYFRRSAETGPEQTSDILNLSEYYEKNKNQIDPKKNNENDFLQRYMKLTHCDLFFADAAILVEGNVERLLLPLMIEMSSPQLQSNYLSILEVGGAFAHRFRKLIEFLGLATLVITDLDSVEKNNNGRWQSCSAWTKGAKTSNQMLKEWLPNMDVVADLLRATDDQNTQNPSKDSPAIIRVCYQNNSTVKWNGETDKNLPARTFEEAFAFENLKWCQDKKQEYLGLAVISEEKKEQIQEIAEKIHDLIKSDNFKKTNFALSLLMADPGDWKVPAYISEGLQWLGAQITVDNENSMSGEAKGKSGGDA